MKPDPDAAVLEALARKALQRLPAPLREMLADVAVHVEELPDRETLAHFGIRDPYGLLGLYHGVSLPHKSSFISGEGPDVIVLYRRPIIAFWRAGSDSLADIVTHILIHEAGHHFGFSDAEMAAIERGARGLR